MNLKFFINIYYKFTWYRDPVTDKCVAYGQVEMFSRQMTQPTYTPRNNTTSMDTEHLYDDIVTLPQKSVVQYQLLSML